MNVSLIDVDGHHFPNLALMKLSAWHKMQGDSVEWYSPLFSHPDMLYASKVFTFTNDYKYIAPKSPHPIQGGTGYDLTVKLPDEVEKTVPDYSIYPEFTKSIGFLSRGCIRSCPWCVVPKKEGEIQVVDDIEKISNGRREVLLLDNNFLATSPEYVTEQLSKAKRMNLKLDFNQGLDARLVTERNAKELSEVKWINYIRFSCDTEMMIDYVENAVRMMRSFGYRGDFFIYILAKEVDETHDRICRIASIDRRMVPFCQPYRDFTSKVSYSDELQKLARWCNIQSIRKTVTFKQYKDRFYK